MIHYHGTPIGGPSSEAARFLIGRHAMVSFARPDQIGAVAECCQSFALDNGAFSVWKKGGVLDFDGYLAFVETWQRHPGFDWCLIPDVIDGDEAANDAMLARWCDASTARSVPVWHMHESIERLSRLASNWDVVAIGSSGQWPDPGREGWWRRMSEAMSEICDEDGRPPCRLHGLRMLDPAIFHRLPFASADSTNVARNNNQVRRFGMYCPPSESQRAAVIADRIEAHNSACRWVPMEEQGVLAFMEQSDDRETTTPARPAELGESYGLPNEEPIT